MKPILPVIATALILASASSCMSDNNWDKYEEWRNDNIAWYEQLKTRTDDQGNPYYTRLSPAWDPSCGVLIHFFNDRRLTEGNLSPLQTSTVDMKYLGQFYNGEPFDSSYTSTQYGDSIYRSRVSDNIVGWQVALNAMHVGDSVEVIIPFSSAYGANGYMSIPPYSYLRFYMKLVDIPAYEIETPQDN